MVVTLCDQDASKYIHRVGRTGRAGKSGMSIILHTNADYKALQECQKAAVCAALLSCFNYSL